MEDWRDRVIHLVPWVAASMTLALLVGLWASRLVYPYDLEWMEGGMLAHAWRLDQGLPLYVAPNPDFIPFIYPPGYPSLVAGLGKIVGLTLPLGRAVSLCGIGAAASALGFGVWRHTGAAAAGVFASVVFLGAFPHSGAFYDLVRPDSLALGLCAWSIALAAERWRGATEAAALLLCASFLCKHNLAAFGLPLAIGLWMRDGWRSAVRFGALAAVPALAFTVFLQWQSDGNFLTYLVGVPASHPQHGDRVLPGLPRELGNALPVSLATLGGWAVFQSRGGPPWTAALPVLAGFALAFGCQLAPPAVGGLTAVGAALGGFGIGAGIVGVLMSAKGSHQSWRWGLAIGIAAVALVLGGLMRSHHGGFTNVYMPLHWAVAGGFGLVLAQLMRGGWGGLAALLATAELVIAASTLDSASLQPTAADRERGDAFVEALRAVDGPVFSPMAAWLPAQAGHPPSLHMIAVWDLVYEGGPFEDQVRVVQMAIRDQYWGAVVGGTRAFTYPYDESYQSAQVIGPQGHAFDPKTGYPVRPVRILMPR